MLYMHAHSKMLGLWFLGCWRHWRCAVLAKHLVSEQNFTCDDNFLFGGCKFFSSIALSLSLTTNIIIYSCLQNGWCVLGCLIFWSKPAQEFSVWILKRGTVHRIQAWPKPDWIPFVPDPPKITSFRSESVTDMNPAVFPELVHISDVPN